MSWISLVLPGNTSLHILLPGSFPHLPNTVGSVLMLFCCSFYSSCVKHLVHFWSRLNCVFSLQTVTPGEQELGLWFMPWSRIMPATCNCWMNEQWKSGLLSDTTTAGLSIFQTLSFPLWKMEIILQILLWRLKKQILPTGWVHSYAIYFILVTALWDFHGMQTCLQLRVREWRYWVNRCIIKNSGPSLATYDSQPQRPV